MKVHYQSRIRFLEGFSYIEGLSDKGVGVSEKAKELSELMNNPEKLEEERTKSQDLRKKLGKCDSSGFKDKGEYNPKYGGFSHDMQDAYKMSIDEDSIRSKKKDVFDKDREISFNKKDEEYKPKSESRSDINEQTHEKTGNSKKIEDDFDFTESAPTTKQKACPSQNSVNLLDVEPTETPSFPEKKDKPQPISMNLLDDLNFGPANTPPTYNLAIH